MMVLDRKDRQMLKTVKLASVSDEFALGAHGNGADTSTGGEYDKAWAQACRRLRAEVGEDVFNSWFGRLELEDVSGGIARLSVPTKFLKSWITSHYTDRIVAVLGSEIPGVTAATISVRNSTPRAPVAPRAPRETPTPTERAASSCAPRSSPR